MYYCFYVTWIVFKFSFKYVTKYYYRKYTFHSKPPYTGLPPTDWQCDFMTPLHTHLHFLSVTTCKRSLALPCHSSFYFPPCVSFVSFIEVHWNIDTNKADFCWPTCASSHNMEVTLRNYINDNIYKSNARYVIEQFYCRYFLMMIASLLVCALVTNPQTFVSGFLVKLYIVSFFISQFLP